MDSVTIKAVITICILAFMALWIIALKWRVENLEIDKRNLEVENAVIKFKNNVLLTLVIG